ncbi:MAG: hypothetical protein HYZ51_03555 [Candidatus Doudnabacteria bacterium]|nr:hypothetical protein [Candidatus Doudnabacteria bacterium]
MKSKVIIITMVVILAIIGLVWYWQNSDKAVPILPSPNTQTPKQQPAPKTKEEGLGAQVYEKVGNPAKDTVPETNPFKEQYQNPFQ